MTYIPTAWVDYGVPCIDAANLNNMEAGIDRAQGDVMVLRGLTAAIPASDPLLVGRLYFESDLLLRVWRDNGAGWDQVHAVAAAGGAWTFIAETILGAPAATVTFAAIAGTYRTLAMVLDARTDIVADSDALAWRANGDSGNNYNWMLFTLYDNADIGTSGRPANMARLGYCDGANAAASVFGGGIAYWRNYAVAGHQRLCNAPNTGTIGNLNVDADIRVRTSYSHWASTAVITSLTILPVTGPNLVAGSRFQLYGIT